MSGVKCSKCNRKFLQNETYEKHVLTCREGDRKYRCDRCGQKFYHLTDVKEHLANVHKVKKYLRYKCKICPARFYKESRLANHVCGKRKTAFSKKAFQVQKGLLKSKVNTSGNKTNDERVTKYYCLCGLRYEKWEWFERHVDSSHRDRPVHCTGCKKAKCYTSAKQVRAHMLQCIRFHGYPTIYPNNEGEHANDQVNNETMCQRQSLAKTNLKYESIPEVSHTQPDESTDAPFATLRSIITSATLTKSDQIVAVRNVLDKKLSGFIAKKIENILTNKTNIKTEYETVEDFGNYTETENTMRNLNMDKDESSDCDNFDDVPNCQVATKSSELKQSKTEMVSCDSVNTSCSERNEEPFSNMGCQSFSAFPGGQMSGIFPEKRVACAKPQTRSTFIHQTQLCRSCGKIYSDGNFYAIEPEDLCECQYQFLCKLCQTSFKRVVELRQHLVDQHIFRTCLCGIPFANVSLLESHREYGMCPAEIIPVNHVTFELNTDCFTMIRAPPESKALL